jgi:TPR repeat protein
VEAVDFLRFISQNAQDEGRAQHSALWQLSELLLSHPELANAGERSWELLQTSADLGNPAAQHRLSAALGTGIYGSHLVPMDATRSLLLEHMAALSGDPGAALGMGYRLLRGVGAAVSCERALPYLKLAADHAAISLERIGMTSSSSSQDILLHLSEDVRMESSQELADYYGSLAQDGDAGASAALGSLYALGSRGLLPDESRALHYLHRAHQLGSTSTDGILGYTLIKRRLRYLKFANLADLDQLSQDNNFVLDLLQRGHRRGQVPAALGLGLAHWHGLLDQHVNFTAALDLFQRNLNNHPDAGLYLGDLLLSGGYSSSTSSAGSVGAASEAYSVSAQLGNLLSLHKLAHLASKGFMSPSTMVSSSSTTTSTSANRACEVAASQFVAVAQRREDLVRDLYKAHNLVKEKKRHDLALDIYARYFMYMCII